MQAVTLHTTLGDLKLELYCEEASCQYCYTPEWHFLPTYTGGRSPGTAFRHQSLVKIFLPWRQASNMTAQSSIDLSPASWCKAATQPAR